MKKKFTRILGVALPLAMVLALAITLLPASTPEAEAGVGTLKFENIPLLKYDEDGDWLLAPNTDVGAIAVTAGGSVMFAAADITDPNNINTLLKSADGGYTWTRQPGFRTSANATGDNTSIVAIGVSPEYASDTTVFVATADYVWTSVDGGTDFTEDRPSGWGTSENITDMDITLDEGGRLSTIIGTEDVSYGGDVYVQCPSTTGMSWQEQLIGRDVLTVAFSPDFASDECIMAVTADGTDTKLELAFGSTETGGGWGDSIGDAELLDGRTSITTPRRARIAFPDDYDVDSLISNIAFVGLTAELGSNEVGDVFKVVLETGATSMAIDLNVRGVLALEPTETNIWSIDISGDAEAATIIVGLEEWSTVPTPDYYLTYYSTDSGDNWYSARTKSPTGGTRTVSADAPNALIAGPDAQANVMMAPDFATSGVAYAVTSGAETSAVSRTADGGKSWNQISLIDYRSVVIGVWGSYCVQDFDPNAVYGSTPTAYMVTSQHPLSTSRGTAWKTTNGGGTWERILSYANPGVTDTLLKLYVTGASTVFVTDYANGRFWRSSDDGATFPRVVSAKTGGLAVVAVYDETSIWTVNSLGAIWSTTNLGRPWVEPEESDVLGEDVTDVWKRGDIILIPTESGQVFISTDAGVTYTDKVGVSDLPGRADVSYDGDYDTNHFVYACVVDIVSDPNRALGIWRIELNEDDPNSTEWKRIDGGPGDDNANAGAGRVRSMVGFQLVGPALYYWDYASVNTTATAAVGYESGGIWRSVNPTADVDSIYPPRFEHATTDLIYDHVVGYAGYAVYPNTLFVKSYTAPYYPTYYNQVYAFGDVLADPVSLVLPDDGATDVGTRLTTIDLTMEVLAGWATMPSALSYEYQLALDEEFLSPVSEQSGSGTGQQARFDRLPLGVTYYWRVRVDSPLLSPWSEGRTFTIGTVEPEVVGVPFGITSPELGATDVSIQPTFVWAEYEGATSYELVVAEDPTFAIIDWSRTSANTFYKAEEALAYDTTYAWKVRAAPDGPWATGIFTTEAVPVEPVEPAVTEPAAPAEIKIVEVPAAAPIPTYLLWTIIGVGAVLFIALIVLIVRTRRVT